MHGRGVQIVRAEQQQQVLVAQSQSRRGALAGGLAAVLLAAAGPLPATAFDDEHKVLCDAGCAADLAEKPRVRSTRVGAGAVGCKGWRRSSRQRAGARGMQHPGPQRPLALTRPSPPPGEDCLWPGVHRLGGGQGSSAPGGLPGEGRASKQAGRLPTHEPSPHAPLPPLPDSCRGIEVH